MENPVTRRSVLKRSAIALGLLPSASLQGSPGRRSGMGRRLLYLKT